MTDEELDEMLAGSVVADRDVARLDLREGERDLLEEIMSTPVLGQPGRRTDETVTSPRRHRWLVPSVAAAAAVAAVATASVWAPWSDEASRSGGGAPDTTGVATAPSTAPAPAKQTGNPLLLVDDPAWTVKRLDESAEDRGEMTFTDGEHYLDLTWYPAAQHEMYFEDRAHDLRQSPLTVLGAEGTMFRYSSSDFATILPADGPSFLEIRGDVGSREAYVDLLGRLKPVDLETWAAAMPSDVVSPESSAAVVARMLEDVPVPPGFDTTVLESDLFMDRYQLGAQVAGAVSCSWLDAWDDAREADDAAASKRAVKAMRSSREWTVLHQMDKQGDYPGVVWELADKMAEGDPGFTREYWVPGLGCDGKPHSLNMD